MANAAPDESGIADALKQMFGGYTFEDRRLRATDLMRAVEPDFVPVPVISVRASSLRSPARLSVPPWATVVVPGPLIVPPIQFSV